MGAFFVDLLNRRQVYRTLSKGVVIMALLIFFCNILVRKPVVDTEGEGRERRSQDNANLIEDERSLKRSCSPQHHIMFLKTHKCASSSVQNIFLRYGAMHNLTFALPEKYNYLGNPYLFKAEMIPKYLLPPSGVVDIFTVHTRLNPEEHRKVLHPDTVFVTAVRDPVELFESFFNYYKLSHVYGAELEEFLNWPFEMQQSFKRPFGRYGPNTMLFDMGHHIHPNMTASEVQHAIDSADKFFDLVLIAEKLDESLIFLKELLCWDYSDIVFFTKNARREEMKKELSSNSVKNLRRLQSADILLYDYFLAKHNQAVLRYGVNKMAYEVSVLRSLRQNMFDECGVQVVNKYEPKSIFREYSNQVNGYVLEGDASLNCILLSLPEMVLVDKLRLNQLKRLSGSVK